MFHAALRSLLMHKLRSLLTVLGLVFGVASVIVMLAVAEGASEEAQNQIESLGVTNVIVRSRKPTDQEIQNPNGDDFMLSYGLTYDDMRRIEESIETVVNITPQREFVHEARFRDQSIDARVVGVYPNYAASNRLLLTPHSRFIEPSDLKLTRNVCVIGEELARKLFRHQSPLNRSIQVGRRNFFRIVGVTRWRAPSAGIGSSLSAQDYNRDIYIPLTTDRARIGEVLERVEKGGFSQERIELSQLTIQVADIDAVKPTADVLDGLLAKFHPDEDYAITVPLDLLEQARATQRIFNFVLGSTAAISLLVGGIGIMNIMLATVSERTQEIGIRRALGANQMDITMQFLVETSVLSFVGTMIGLVIGVASPYFVGLASGMNVKLTFWAPAVAVIVAFGVGMVFGIYPARQAARLDPIEALRRV